MKHATSRLLFAYWDTLRGERAAPERAAIRPGDIRQVLADTFILGARADGSAAFRLAGTRCSALFGQDLKDVPFAALWSEDRAGEPAHLIEAVLGEGTALVAGLTGTNTGGARLALELVLLPLRHHGATNARCLGALSPGSVPSWLGLMPLRSVELQSTRLIAGSPGRPGSPPELASTGRKRRFAVVVGGLSG